MKNIKLIRLLKTFTPAEFQDFGKFVHSPFHNESSNLISLYNFFKKFYPGFNDQKLTKELIFKHLYGEAKYDDKRMRDRFSAMLKLAEDYLAYLGMMSYPPRQKRFILRQYAARGLENHFEKKYKEIDAFLENHPVKDAEYFEQTYLQVRDRLEFYQHKNLTGQRRKIYDELEEEVSMYLRSFCAEMFTYYVIMSNWEGGLNYKFSYTFYDEVMRLFEMSDHSDAPMLKTFYLILKMRDNLDEDSHYYELKEVYLKNIEIYNEIDKLTVGAVLYNEATERSFAGKPGFNRECFELIKMQIEHDLYPRENEWLSRDHYMICVSVPLSLGEDKWVEWFINNYTDRLNPDRRETAFHYANAFLHYTRKNYDSALAELALLKGMDHFYYIAVKLLQSKIFFEIRDYESVLTTIDSFKHFLSANSTVTDSKKSFFGNYIKFLHRLTSIALKPDDFKLDKLIKDINSITPGNEVANKTWLLERAKALNIAYEKP